MMKDWLEEIKEDLELIEEMEAKFISESPEDGKVKEIPSEVFDAARDCIRSREYWKAIFEGDPITQEFGELLLTGDFHSALRIAVIVIKLIDNRVRYLVMPNVLSEGDEKVDIKLNGGEDLRI